MADTYTPGQKFDERQWRSMLDTLHGGLQSSVQVPFKKTNESTATEDEAAYRQNPTYRYYFRDGSYMDVRKTAPGAIDYEVVEYKPSAESKKDTEGVNVNISRQGGVQTTTSSPSGSTTSTKTEPAPADATKKGTYGPEPVTGPGGNVDMVTWEMDVDPATGAQTKGRIIDQHPATQKELEAYKAQQAKGAEGTVPLEGYPGIFTKATKTVSADGTSTVDKTIFVDAQGQEVADPRKPKPIIKEDPQHPGQYISIAEDPSAPGGYRVTQISPSGAIKPGGGPSLQDLEVRYDSVVGDLKNFAAKLQQAVSDGVMTQQDAKDRWDDAKSVATAEVGRINNLITTQRGIYADQAANWRQQQATANTRLNASVQSHQLGVQTANQLKGLDPGGTAGMGAIVGALARGRAAGELFGGYANDTPPALPRSLQSMMEMEIPGVGTLRINRDATGATPGPTSGGNITQGTAGLPPSAGAIDQSALSAVQQDVAAAGGGGSLLRYGGGLPGGAPPAPGMNYSNGQFRAPVSLPPPEQMPISAMLGDSYGTLRDAGFDDDIIGAAAQQELGSLYG